MGPEYQVQASRRFVVLPVLAVHFIVASTFAQEPLAPPILSAKTIYFKDQSGSDADGKNALAALQKWGRFQIVHDQKQADLILLLSLEQYQGPDSASPQTGDLDNGDVSHIPRWNQQKPTRYAYLTVIDPKTGASLWSAEHIWGGLLTGFNGVGERLVKELERQVKK